MSFLPNNLLVLFNPRPFIDYKPPTDKLPWERKTKGYTGYVVLHCYLAGPRYLCSERSPLVFAQGTRSCGWRVQR